MFMCAANDLSVCVCVCVCVVKGKEGGMETANLYPAFRASISDDMNSKYLLASGHIRSVCGKSKREARMN